MDGQGRGARSNNRNRIQSIQQDTIHAQYNSLLAQIREYNPNFRYSTMRPLSGSGSSFNQSDISNLRATLSQYQGYVYSNVKPLDPVVTPSNPVRQLNQDANGRYWLNAGGNLYTPSGSYDFVVLPGGTTLLARTNGNSQRYSTHLGLSNGQDVSYVGKVTFFPNHGAQRGQVRVWNNDTGHYWTQPTHKPNAGFPTGRFEPYQPTRKD